MSKPNLTSNDVQRIENLGDKARGDRVGAYVVLWQLTGSSEALRQARISSFSGGDGGASFGANLDLQQKVGTQYPAIFELSQQVFESSRHNVKRNNDDIQKRLVLVKLCLRARSKPWPMRRCRKERRIFLKHDFPENLFVLNFFSGKKFNGLQFSQGSLVALEGARDAVLFQGK